MTYSEKLRDPRWQRRRLEVMGRDEFTCRDCGSDKKTLQVHHCFYEKGEPWDTKEEFLLTLCSDCHVSRGELEADGKRMLAQIFVNTPNAEDDESLRELVSSMAKMTSREDAAPVMMDMLDFDNAADIRWFRYAWDNPIHRPMYEAVVGRKVTWPKSDDVPPK
jgi:hypothetical protein